MKISIFSVLSVCMWIDVTSVLDVVMSLSAKNKNKKTFSNITVTCAYTQKQLIKKIGWDNINFKNKPAYVCTWPQTSFT